MPRLTLSYKKNSLNAVPEIIVLGASLLVSLLSLYKYSFFYPYLYLGYGFYANVFCGLLFLAFYLISVNGQINREDFPFFAFVVLSESYFIISALVTNGGLRYPGVIFITMMYTFAVKRMHIPTKLYKIFFFAVTGILFLYASNAKGYFELQWGKDGEVLAANSDYLGTLAVILIIFLDFSSKYFKKKKLINLICILGHILTFYIIWECKSRASLGSWTVFTILYFCVPDKFLKTKKVGLMLFYGALAFALLFPVFYVKMSTLFDITIMGRSGLNRLRVWSYALEHIGDTQFAFIFGHGTHSALREDLGYPAHNVFYQTWYDTGIIGLILTLGFMIIVVQRLFKTSRKMDSKQITAYIGFVACILYDCFGTTNTEAIVIWEFIILGETLKPSLGGDTLSYE